MGDGQRATPALDSHVDVYMGTWEPRRRESFVLPANLPREVHRLLWHLQDVGCVRSPFISHPDCDLDGPYESMCSRCRALRPYRASCSEAEGALTDSEVVDGEGA